MAMQTLKRLGEGINNLISVLTQKQETTYLQNCIGKFKKINFVEILKNRKRWKKGVLGD